MRLCGTDPFTYDNIGQLKTASGIDHTYDSTLGSYVDTPRLHEQFGYTYDAAWNLNRRTNNALVQTFNVNNLNELTTATRSGTLTVAGTATEPKGGVSGSPPGVTNVTVSGTGLTSGSAQIYHEGDWARAGATLADGNNSYTATAQDTYGRTSQDSVSVSLPATSTFVYDLSGNLRTNNTRIFDYDDEDQLVRVTEPNTWKTEFTYDGLLRMRIRKEFTWNGSWTQTNEEHYVYDGQLVIQERDVNNLPLVTYTRGNDLSCTLQEAGGIGGLLARTDNGQMIAGSSTATAYYFSDANGNITSLVYTNGMIAARYNYDPFGRALTMSGPLAAANRYRFSSKEFDDNTGLYCYGFRYYDPNLQRWLNRDPIAERGGINLYDFAENSPINKIDLFGLDIGGHGPYDMSQAEMRRTGEYPWPDDPPIRDEGPQQLADAFELYNAVQLAKGVCSAARSLGKELARELATREMIQAQKAVAAGVERLEQARIADVAAQGGKRLAEDLSPRDALIAASRAVSAKEELIAAEKALEGLKQKAMAASAKAANCP